MVAVEIDDTWPSSGTFVQIDGDFFIEGTLHPEKVLDSLAEEILSSSSASECLELRDPVKLDRRSSVSSSRRSGLSPSRRSGLSSAKSSDNGLSHPADQAHLAESVEKALNSCMKRWEESGILFIGISPHGLTQAVMRTLAQFPDIATLPPSLPEAPVRRIPRVSPTPFGRLNVQEPSASKNSLKNSSKNNLKDNSKNNSTNSQNQSTAEAVSVRSNPRWQSLNLEIIHNLSAPPMSPAMQMGLDEALGQAVARGDTGPVLRFWEWGSPAVVLGLHQSVSHEIHEDLAKDKGFTIVRRLTGGGAMFIEPGNTITYSLYLPLDFVAEMSVESSYPFCDAWALEALNTLGVKAFYQPINDISSPLGKIGGAAQRRFSGGESGPGCLLHHVTMAYDIDAHLMTSILKISPEKSADKSVESAAKRVDPLKTQTGCSRQEIINFMYNFLLTALPSAKSGELGSQLMAEAERLSTNKYAMSQWVHRIP